MTFRTADLTFVQLNPHDTPQCMTLSTEAGWNQTTDDWSVMIRAGHGIGYKSDNRLIATALIVPFPPTLAWLSMVLVTKGWQRKGIATALMTECIENANRLKLAPVLDATVAGREVYARLGFVDRIDISRFERPPIDSNSGFSGFVKHNRVSQLAPDAVSELAQIDDDAFGADRRHLLEHLVSHNLTRSWSSYDPEGRISGYVTGRIGQHTYQLGPLVADTFETAASLAEQIVLPSLEALVIDVPDAQQAFQEWLGARGFVRSRGFVRMTIDADISLGDMKKCFAIGGPEFG